MSFIFSSFFHLQFLLPLRLYSMRPVILWQVALVKDSGVGLLSPGALENPASMLRTLSSLAVTGESDPAAIPSNSFRFVVGGHPLLCWYRIYIHGLGLIPDAFDGRRQLCFCWGVPGLVDVGDVLYAQLLIKGLFFYCLPGGSSTGTPPPAPPVSHAGDGWIPVVHFPLLSGARLPGAGAFLSRRPTMGWWNSDPWFPALPCEGTPPIVLQQRSLVGSAGPMWDLVPSRNAPSWVVRNRDELGSRM